MDLYLFMVALHYFCALVISTHMEDRLIENGWLQSSGTRASVRNKEDTILGLVTILIFLTPVIHTIFTGLLIYCCFHKREDK